MLYKYVCSCKAATARLMIALDILVKNPMMFFPDTEGFVRWMGPNNL